MFKKLAVLAAACGFSLCASASVTPYVEYDLKNVKFDGGRTLSGWFVQNTTNGAIAFYDINGSSNTYLPGFDSNVTHASVTVPGGPTSFDAWTSMNGTDLSSLHLVFGSDTGNGEFSVSGFENVEPLPGGSLPAGSHAIVSGSAALGQVDPGLLALLEAGTSGFDEVLPSADTPAAVPEPASLALLALGACAMGGLRRRSRQA